MSPTLPRRALLALAPALLILALLILAPASLLTPPCRAAVKDPDKATTAADATEALQQTPEGALRAFLASMLGPDPATLRQVILPVSEADFAVLLASRPMSTEARQIEVGRIASLPIRSLKAGDTVALPGGRSLKIAKDDVGRDHVLLQMSSGPLPILVRRLNGRWYVDAAPIIAARRTAAALRRQLPQRLAAKRSSMKRSPMKRPVKRSPGKR